MTPRQREARIRATREAEGRERRLVAVGLVLLGLVVVAAFAFLTGRATAAREAENDAARALEPPPPDPWARPKAVLPAASGALAEAPEPAAALSAEAPEPAPVASATAYRREEWPRDAPAAPAGGVYVRGYVRKDGTYVRPHVRHRPTR